VRTLLFLLACASASAECPPSGARLVVEAHELQLCDGGRLEHRYRVALGRGGFDKRRQGDERTPLGEYPLAPGRPSAEFHRFLHVGYPTAGEQQAGYTGGDIGVHGPGRKFRLLGALSTLSDWTAGCIAVGSDAEIEEIDAWARAHQARTILIRR
jgi:hypothetical protein